MSLSETGVSARVLNDVLNTLPRQVRDAYLRAHNKSWVAVHDKLGGPIEYTQEEIDAFTAFETALAQKKEHGKGARPHRLHSSGR